MMANSNNDDDQRNIISSLYLSKNKHQDDDHVGDKTSDGVQCLVCDEVFKDDDIDGNEAICNRLQKHLLLEHKLMIACISSIVDLKNYCKFWRKKISNCQDLKQICATIKTNCGSCDDSPSEVYHMIGGDDEHFPEDSQLRSDLKNSKLASILSQYQFERNDDQFSRRCIFCRKTFTGNRCHLFDHLNKDHNFSVGHPDNIVYCNQLLDLLDEKLAQMKCLYCEKIFTSWPVLKEHMRKKGHKLLNPNNNEYDRFYLINYLSPEKHWQEIKDEEDDPENNVDDDNEWDDWVDDSSDECKCLFCQFRSPFEKIKDHLLKVHQLSLDSIINNFEFYSRIKIINYIRRCVHEKRCHGCQQIFSSDDELLVHMEFSGHSAKLPSSDDWDVPEYFFPTFEDDSLLHFLTNDEDDDK